MPSPRLYRYSRTLAFIRSVLGPLLCQMPDCYGRVACVALERLARIVHMALVLRDCVPSSLVCVYLHHLRGLLLIGDAATLTYLQQHSHHVHGTHVSSY